MSQKNNKSKDTNETEFIDIDYQIEEAENETLQSSSDMNKTESSFTDTKADNTLIEEIKSLYRQIEEKDAQYEKTHQRLLRALADYENLRKRTQSEKSRIIKQANESLLLKLLDLADTFEKAEKELSSTDTVSKNTVFDGFKAAYNQFNSILKNQGVQRIDCIGQKFDPNFHEVVLVKPSSNYEEETILEEIQNGYLLNSELLRPAKVVIVKNLHIE